MKEQVTSSLPRPLSLRLPLFLATRVSKCVVGLRVVGVENQPVETEGCRGDNDDDYQRKYRKLEKRGGKVVEGSRKVLDVFLVVLSWT